MRFRSTGALALNGPRASLQHDHPSTGRPLVRRAAHCDRWL